MSLGLNRRYIPSFRALLAFEAAARTGSFTAAAAELNLTQGAISRHVKLLEEQLGVPLFNRIRQRIALTEAGQFYRTQMAGVLLQIASITAQTIAFQGQGGNLQLAMVPTFGTRWLIPRLPDFFARHPDVTIHFSTRIRPFNFTNEMLDAAILFYDTELPKVESHFLFSDQLLLVASPDFVNSYQIKKLSDVSRKTLLIQETRLEICTQWKSDNRFCGKDDTHDLVFEQWSMVIRAAIAGLGLALVPKILIKQELRSRRLISLFDQSIATGHGYYLVYPRENRRLPSLAAFRTWLLDRAAKEGGGD